MYSYGPLHMAEQIQGGQLKPTFNSSMRIWGVALGTRWKRWTIERVVREGQGYPCWWHDKMMMMMMMILHFEILDQYQQLVAVILQVQLPHLDSEWKSHPNVFWGDYLFKLRFLISQSIRGYESFWKTLTKSLKGTEALPYGGVIYLFVLHKYIASHSKDTPCTMLYKETSNNIGVLIDSYNVFNKSILTK